MLPKSKRILLLLLGIFALSSQIAVGLSDERKYEDYKRGEQVEQFIETKIDNLSQKYNVFLKTEAESLSDLIPNAPSFPPYGMSWIESNTIHQPKKSQNFAPTGKSYLYYTAEMKGSPLSEPSYEFELTGKNRTYNFDLFNVKIEAKPIKMVIQKSGKPKTSVFYNYTITITDR